MIVDFWADWCGWCDRLDQNTYADPWVVRKAQEFVAVKVNTEGSRKEIDVAVRYQVTSLPTIVFLSPEGRQLFRVNGFQGPGQFPRTLEEALRAARTVMSWEEALARDPDDPRALLALGSHLFDQEYFDECARAAAEGRRPRRRGGRSTERRRTRMLLAILEHVDRNFAEAERLVKEALASGRGPEDQPKLLFVLGRTYVSWGREDEGVATMEVIVREYPQSPVAAKARETLVNLRRAERLTAALRPHPANRLEEAAAGCRSSCGFSSCGQVAAVARDHDLARARRWRQRSASASASGNPASSRPQTTRVGAWTRGERPARRRRSGSPSEAPERADRREAAGPHGRPAGTPRRAPASRGRRSWNTSRSASSTSSALAGQPGEQRAGGDIATRTHARPLRGSQVEARPRRPARAR